ncbi:MAG: hypothetical protein ACI9J3_001014 [Parvicellaceae bacterium]|jgi:hypothetical protein
MKKVYLLVFPLIVFSCTDIDEKDRLPEWDEVVLNLDIPEEVLPKVLPIHVPDSVLDSTFSK